MLQHSTFLLAAYAAAAAAAAAGAIPPHCTAPQVEHTVGSQGHVDYFRDEGVAPFEGRCWAIECPLGGDLHIRWHRFLMNPEGPSGTVYMQYGSEEPFVSYNSLGPLTPADPTGRPAASVVTRVPLAGRKLLIHFNMSETETDTYPGFRFDWRCGADPAVQPPPETELPPAVAEECWREEVAQGTSGSITRMGFEIGTHCWTLPACPSGRIGVRFLQRRPALRVLRWTPGQEAEDVPELFPADQWSQVVEGRVVLVYKTRSRLDTSFGLRAEWQCGVPQGNAHTTVDAMHLSRCDAAPVLPGDAQGGEAVVNLVRQPASLCRAVSCPAGGPVSVWVNLHTWYPLTGTGNNLEVLQPHAWATPSQHLGLNTAGGGDSAGEVQVPSEVALVRFTRGDGRVVEGLPLSFTVRWRCGGEAVTPAPTPAPDSVHGYCRGTEVTQRGGGSVDFLFDHGFPWGAHRCWVLECDAGEQVHIRWDRFTISQARFTPPTAVLRIRHGQTAGIIKEYSGTGMFEMHAVASVFESYDAPAGLVLEFESVLPQERHPGFTAQWSCGAPPPAATAPVIESEVTRAFVSGNCSRYSVADGPFSRWGYSGMECWVLPKCGADKTMVVTVGNMSVVQAHLDVWGMQDVQRVVSLRDETRKHSEWRGSFSGEADVVLQLNATFTDRVDARHGFDASYECVDTGVPPSEELYLPECDTQSTLTGGVLRVALNDETSVLRHCYILSCPDSDNVTVDVYGSLGTSQRTLEVLQPHSYESPAVLGSVNYVGRLLTTVDGPVAVVRYHVEPPAWTTLRPPKYVIAWECSTEAPTPSPVPEPTSPPPSAGVQWCRTDAHCRRYGDESATCSAGRCSCTAPYAHAEHEGRTAYTCIAPGRRSQETVQITWAADCAAYTPAIGTKVGQALQDAVAGTAGAATHACGSFVLSIPLADVDTRRVATLDRTAVAALLRQHPEVHDAVGEPSDVTLLWVALLQCDIPHATATGVGCRVEACEAGYTPSAAASTCDRYDSSDDGLSDAEIIGIVIGSVAGVLLCAGVAAAARHMWLSKKARNEQSSAPDVHPNP